MTSSWLTRAFVAVTVVGVLALRVSSSTIQQSDTGGHSVTRGHSSGHSNRTNRGYFIIDHFGGHTSCQSVTGGRWPSPERLLEVARLCDAILARSHDVTDDVTDVRKKRKWSENTMMTWGKRTGGSGGLNTVYGLKFCQSLRRSLIRLGNVNFMVALNEKNTGWDENDLKLSDKRARRGKWSENTMATWGRKK